MRTSVALAALSAMAALGLVPLSQGCSADEDTSLITGGTGGTSTAAGGTGGSAGGGTGASINIGGMTGSGGGSSCAQSSAEATLVNRPVDIIIAIDNSGSMSAEIEEVEEQINANFATIIDNANPPIDYRVIMLSRFGSYSSNGICVASPLGGIPDANSDGHCDSIPSQPVNTAKFFHHAYTVSSHNALCLLLQYYTTSDQYGLQPNGYQDVLRDDSFKFFLVITDDGVGCSGGGYSYSDGNNVTGGDTVAAQWDADVLALGPSHFGPDAANRNYSFWGITALAPYQPTTGNPYGDPHPPTAPVITGECTPSAVDPGTGYQSLAVLTGGYRYPTCGLDYTSIFQLMAQGVIQGAQVACEFEIPDPPPGETLDLDTVEVEWSSDGQPVTTFDQVGSVGECTATSFYIDGNTIHLCPDACAAVQADENAEISILFGCELEVD
ncbi:MAG: hypothetical protein JRI23_28195 [Deltaproteobacteria bacterium]|jgi:hypothetical protein|nr:hypothetical protein [Deltaproteobacteria bacterium]MBW2535973.1 hypothetical protein [Deltaproteobacteria bacterium]